MRIPFITILAILPFVSLIGQRDRASEATEKVAKMLVEPADEAKDLSTGREFKIGGVLSSQDYKTGELKPGIFWFRKRGDNYTEPYGILKNGKVLLPDIFNKGAYDPSISEEGDLRLALSYKHGVFNVFTESWDIPLVYESLRTIGSSLLVAQKGGKRGVIDQSNNVIEDFKWDRIESISGLNNYFIVKQKSSGYNYFNGVYNVLNQKLVVPCEYDVLNKISATNLFRVKKDGTYNFINVNNVAQFKTWYDKLYFINDGHGFSIAKKGDKYGVIDLKGKTVVPFKYNYINDEPFTDGSFTAENDKGKFGCIRIDGSVTLPFIYDELKRRDDNGNVVSSQSGKCGMIKVNSGAPYELATCDYDDIESRSNVYIVKQNDKYALLDKYGKLVTKLDYSSITTLKYGGYREQGVYKAEKNGEFVLLSESGNLITEKMFKEIQGVSNRVQEYYSDGISFQYLKFKTKNSSFGLLDLAGMVILEPKYDDIIFEMNNILVVENEGKVGLYNLLGGKEVLPLTYDNIIPGKNSFIAIKGNEFSRVTINGNKAIVSSY